MTGHPPPEENDADPTGVRELLSGLPDPGPMPEGLVLRIEQRIAAEQRSTGRPPWDADRASAGASLVDLNSERRRRRPGRALLVLGAAACTLAAVAVGANQLVGGTGDDSGTAAHHPTLSSASDEDDDTAAGEADAEAGADAGDQADALLDEAPDEGAAEGAETEAADESAPEILSGAGDAGDDPDQLGQEMRSTERLVLLPDLGAYAPDATDLAEAMVQRSREQEATPATQDADAITADEAAACLLVVVEPDGAAAWDRYAAAFAELEGAGSPGGGEPAVAVLGWDGAEEGAAWLLPRTCTTGADVQPLTGPVPYPAS